MKILLLGHTGMLGHMVKKYLDTKGYDVITTNHRWPTDEFFEDIDSFEGDFIINCIGAIHQRTSDFDINWKLPIELDLRAKCNVVHPGTDCEMDDDNYGFSKRIAAEYIDKLSKRTKSIKTSILGPELNTKASLMEWFLSNEDGQTVKGYDSYYWNGNTTLTWAKVCDGLIKNWSKYRKTTVVCSECISKKEILDSINDVFERKINVIADNKVAFEKCLNGLVNTPHIKEQLKELKDFYY